MHQAQSLINRIWYGFDLQRLYLRVDFNTLNNYKDLTLSVDFTSLNLKLQIPLFVSPLKGQLLTKDDKQNWQILKEVAAVAFDKILELALDFSELKVKEKDVVNFFIILESEGLTLERCPLRGLIQIKIPTSDYESSVWSV
jgi:hypothetical protein